MPIANCYTNESIDPSKWENLVELWADSIDINKNNISINVISNFRTIGAKYSLKVELWLPSIWSYEAILKIQNSFIDQAEEVLQIHKSDVFLITQVVESGMVMDRGNLEEW